LMGGRLLGDGFVAFRPDEIKKFFSLTGSAAIAAVACLDCGGVHLTLDPAKLIELAGDRPAK
jgi:hypothetical protein